MVIFKTQPPTGGISDIQNGVIYSFMLSVIYGRDFYIEWSKECSITNSLKPNEVRWDQCPDTSLYDSSIDVNLIDKKYYEYNPSLYRFIFDDYDIINIKANKWEPFMFSNFSNLPSYNESFNKLFNISIPTSLDSIYTNYKEFKSKFDIIIGVQFRTGIQKTWGDGIIDKQENLKHVKDAIHKLSKLYSHNKRIGVYFTTDYSENKYFLKKLLDEYPLFFIDSNIIHTDRSKDVNCIDFDCVLLEQYLLSLSEIIITGRQNFGKVASLRNSVELFYYWNYSSAFRTRLIENFKSLHKRLKYYLRY